MTTEQKPIVERLEHFKQVCVWPGTLICEEGKEPTEAEIKTFVDFFAEEMSIQVQYLEQVVTKPDRDQPFGSSVPGTGGRIDVLFAVHEDDVGRFAVPRFRLGVRWIEDVLAPHNNERMIYDCARLDQYKTW